MPKWNTPKFFDKALSFVRFEREIFKLYKFYYSLLLTAECHEERPGVCRKKGDENGVTGKEEKSEPEEKIFGCSGGRYGGNWC